MSAEQESQAGPFVEVSVDASALLRITEQMPEVLERELRRALEEAGSLFERLAREETPEGAMGGSGGLRGSVYHELRGSPVRELAVGWAAPYAEYVHRGRRPGGVPPRAPIELWVRKVLPGVSEKQLAHVVGAIRFSIAKRGTRGNPFVERTLYRLEPMAQGILDQAAERVAREFRK